MNATAARPGRSIASWGMILFVVVEASLFGLLFFSYFFIREGFAQWPPEPIEDPELGLALVNTALLLSTTFPVVWAERGHRRGDTFRLRFGLLVATAMALAFLTLLVVEYGELQFAPGDNAYASLFYTITGFHAVHLGVGIAMLVVIQTRAWLGHFEAGRGEQEVTNVVLYWHFVDAVWVGVLSVVYLSPRALGP